MIEKEDVLRLYHRLGVLVILSMIVQLSVIIYAFYSNYQGRQDQVVNSRTGCERNKLDRKANAKAWRIAEAARRNSGDISVADQYAVIASGLEERGQVDCTAAFPNASLWR